METLKKQEFKQSSLRSYFGLEDYEENFSENDQENSEIHLNQSLPQQYLDYKGVQSQLVSIPNQMKTNVKVSEWKYEDVIILENSFAKSSSPKNDSTKRYDPRQQSKLSTECKNQVIVPSQEMINQSTADCCLLHLEYQLDQQQIVYDRNDLIAQVKSQIEQIQMNSNNQNKDLENQFEELKINKNLYFNKNTLNKINIASNNKRKLKQQYICRLHSDENLTQKQISKRFKVSLYYIRKVIRDLDNNQLQNENEQFQRRTKATKFIQECLQKYLAEEKEIYTIKDAQSHLFSSFGIKLSCSYIQKIAKDILGLTHKRIYLTSKRANSTKCLAERQWAAFNYIQMMKDQVEIINIDESSLQVVNSKTRGWSRRGYK